MIQHGFRWLDNLLMLAMAFVFLAFVGSKSALFLSDRPQGTAKVFSKPQKGLTVVEQAERVVVHWSGPVDGQMRAAIERTIANYRHDPRSLLLTLNSGGGLVSAGRDLIEYIDGMKRLRRIDTHVEKGAICASMCVPIYLAGSRRTAASKARFMFHEARHAASRSAHVPTTDALFKSDMNYWDINEAWLERMRRSVSGGKDVWLTAEQLVDQGSGVVHAIE